MSDLQDAIACLRLVPLAVIVAVIKGHREYYVGNYRLLLTYLIILEEYHVEVQLLTGIKCQLAQPEPALVHNGSSSTIWQVMREKVDQQLVKCVPLLTRNIVFRFLGSWDQLLHLLKSNLHACITAYVENRFIFSTFAEVEENAQSQLMKRHAENKYGDARQRFVDRQPGATVQRPPENRNSDHRHEEYRRGIVPAPRATSAKTMGLHAMGFAGVFGNVTTLEDDVQWKEDSDEEAHDFSTPCSGSTQAAVEQESDEAAVEDEDTTIQEAIPSLNAVNTVTGSANRDSG